APRGAVAAWFACWPRRRGPRTTRRACAQPPQSSHPRDAATQALAHRSGTSTPPAAHDQARAPEPNPREAPPRRADGRHRTDDPIRRPPRPPTAAALGDVSPPPPPAAPRDL